MLLSRQVFATWVCWCDAGEHPVAPLISQPAACATPASTGCGRSDFCCAAVAWADSGAGRYRSHVASAAARLPAASTVGSCGRWRSGEVLVVAACGVVVVHGFQPASARHACATRRLGGLAAWASALPPGILDCGAPNPLAAASGSGRNSRLPARRFRCPRSRFGRERFACVLTHCNDGSCSRRHVDVNGWRRRKA